MYGPEVGRRNNLALYRESGLSDLLQEEMVMAEFSVRRDGVLA